MAEIDARDFGRLEGRVETLESLLTEVRDDLKIIKKRDDEREGGLKMLLAGAALLGGLVSAGIKWVLDHRMFT